MVKKPAGLRMRPDWKQLDHLSGRHGRRSWAQRSAAPSRAARCGIHSYAHLEAAHGDDLLLLLDLEGEGAGVPGGGRCRGGGEGELFATTPEGPWN
jgi:hypothetical protein